MSKISGTGNTAAAPIDDAELVEYQAELENNQLEVQKAELEAQQEQMELLTEIQKMQYEMQGTKQKQAYEFQNLQIKSQLDSFKAMSSMYDTQNDLYISVGESVAELGKKSSDFMTSIAKDAYSSTMKSVKK